MVSAYDQSVAAFKIKTTNNQYELISVSKNIAVTFSNTPSTLLTIQSHPDKKEHVVALPSYRYDYSGNMVTTYDPNIAKYGKKIPYQDYMGYTHYLTVGFPQAYIPRNFDDDKSPYIWDAGFTYGEWTSKKVGYYYDLRFASYIHGRRPFSVIDNKLVSKNINIRENDDYTYSCDDYSGPFHIQYKDESGQWIKSKDLPLHGGAKKYYSQGLGVKCNTIDQGTSSVTSCDFVNGPPFVKEEPTSVDYLALIGKDFAIYTTSDYSENITTTADGGTGIFNIESQSTQIWERPYSQDYWEHCHKLIIIRNTDSQKDYLEFRIHNNNISTTKLYIDNDLINTFETIAQQEGGEWHSFGETYDYSGETNPPDCWLYEHDLVSNESNHDANISGPVFSISVPNGSYTSLSSDSEYTYQGNALSRVMDYDYDNNGNYILIYEYYNYDIKRQSKTLNIEVGLLETDDKYVGPFPFTCWEGDYYDYSYSDSSTKYKLVFKIDSVTTKVNVDTINHLINENYKSLAGLHENCNAVNGEDWHKTKMSGSRITGISSQISGDSMIYTYVIEQAKEVADEVTWEFLKRVIGIINISNKNLPAGHRQEFEITEDNAGNVNPNFDFKYLAAIGVHAD